MLYAKLLRHVQGLVVLYHGVEERQELAHAGRQRDLLGFACGAQTLVQGCEHRIIADGHEGTSVQGHPHMRAPTPGGAGLPPGATVPIARRDADQGGEARAASGAQLREIEHQRPGTHRPNAGDTPVQGDGLLQLHWLF